MTTKRTLPITTLFLGVGRGTLCVHVELSYFVSRAIRVFRLNDDAVDIGTHRDATGDGP